MVPRTRLVRNWIDVSVSTPLDSPGITVIPHVLPGNTPRPIQQRGHQHPPAPWLPTGLSNPVTKSSEWRGIQDPRLLRCAPIRATTYELNLLAGSVAGSGRGRTSAIVIIKHIDIYMIFAKACRLIPSWPPIASVSDLSPQRSGRTVRGTADYPLVPQSV